MKRIILLFILLGLMSITILPSQAHAQPDYIRLHIVASSDSLSDQAVKLCVRDDIRACAARILADCSNSTEAWQTLFEHQDELLKTARKSAEKYGSIQNVSLELGVYPFPDKVYGEELVPAGEYRAIRITLGEGEGRNWWCVVYPSLCLPEQADTDKPIEFYSSILRWAVRVWEAIRS